MGVSWLGMWIAMAWGSAAWGAPYYLEGPVHTKRAEAARQVRSLSIDEGKARVIRRYQQGAGWQFLVRVEGLEEEEVARTLASTLATHLQSDIYLYDVEAGSDRPVATLPAPPPSDVEDAAEEASTQDKPKPESRRRARPDPSVDLTDPEAVFTRLSAAFGGLEGGQAALDAAEQVTFRFRRTLPTGLVAEHAWARKGTASRLDIRVIEGEGRSSSLRVTPSAAWLAVEGGTLEPSDPERGQETVHRFAPAQQIPFLLVFTRALQDDPTLELLEHNTEGELRLRSAGDRVEGPVRILIDTDGWTIRGVHFEGEDLRYLYSGWEEESALRLPSRIETWRDGALVDTLEIVELAVDRDPPDGWFTAD